MTGRRVPERGGAGAARHTRVGAMTRASMVVRGHAAWGPHARVGAMTRAPMAIGGGRTAARMRGWA